MDGWAGGGREWGGWWMCGFRAVGSDVRRTGNRAGERPSLRRACEITLLVG